MLLSLQLFLKLAQAVFFRKRAKEANYDEKRRIMKKVAVPGIRSPSWRVTRMCEVQAITI